MSSDKKSLNKQFICFYMFFIYFITEVWIIILHDGNISKILSNQRNWKLHRGLERHRSSETKCETVRDGCNTNLRRNARLGGAITLGAKDRFVRSFVMPFMFVRACTAFKSADIFPRTARSLGVEWSLGLLSALSLYRSVRFSWACTVHLFSFSLQHKKKKRKDEPY